MARPHDHRRRPAGTGRPPISVHGGSSSAGPSAHRPPASQGRPSRPAPSRDRQIAGVHNARRRRRKRNYTLYYISLAVMLVITGVVLSLTVFFRVETIEVSGTEIYTREQVLEALDAGEGDSLLRLNPDELEKEVRDQLVKIEKADIRRRFPGTLSVDVTDAVVTEQVVSGGFSYQVSSGGRVVELIPAPLPNVRIVLGPDMRALQPGDMMDRLADLDREAEEDRKKNKEETEEIYTNTRRLEILSALLNEIDRAGIHDISVVDVRDPVNIRLHYQNRFEIRLGTSGELRDKLAMFASVLDRGSLGLEELGVLDISDPDRCIAARDLPALPDGAAVAGWQWTGPHLENFDEFFGYGNDAPPVQGGVLVGGEEQTPPGVQTPDGTGTGGEGGEGSVPSGDGSSPGYIMPQRPQIGGQPASSEPASEPVAEEQQPVSDAGLPEETSSVPEEDPVSEASSEPGYAMPQMPQIGR
ncbi:MAG: FtsQ-type POTRA domain-containing protein [Oscillospiraceae bacterium]|nr:FtsQ-type POTRA domain-containing protein [Oscillospiraceae bacterium]